MIALFLMAAAVAAPDCSLVPGWRAQAAPRTFVADNLFEYMDGNAEGYLIYGFVRMNGITCLKGEQSLIFDVSEFTDPDSAYGMFTANRDSDKPEEKIGTAGQIVPRKVVFVKGNYYVEITANPEGDYTAVLREFARAMEKRLPGRTTLPDALEWFPEAERQSIRLVPESVLGLRALRRGYVAQYSFGKGFLVVETTPESAAGVLEKLRARLGETTPAKLGDEAFQREDRYLGRLCFARKGKYLAGYANVAQGKDPAALTEALLKQLP